MEVGLFAKDPMGKPKLLLSYSLPRGSKSCTPRAHSTVGHLLCKELRQWGVDHLQRPPGRGVVQAFTDDGPRFLRALYGYWRWAGYLEVRSLDREAERLRQHLAWAARRQTRPHRRKSAARDVILCETTITREVKLLSISQRAQLIALRRSIGSRQSSFALTVPRFCSVRPGSSLSDVRVAEPPGRAEMIFSSERDLLNAFRRQTRRINQPSPDLVTRLLLH